MTANSRSSRITRRVQLASSTIAQIAGAIALELRRLNHARIDSDKFSTLTRRDRRRAVKAALAKHHSNTPRCC
jgi:hypothetical protein